MTRLLSLLFFFFTYSLGFAQEEPYKAEAIENIKHASSDSEKVRCILWLDSLYLYFSPDTDAILDSALLLGREAQTLSENISYRPGYEDASFLIANAFAEKKDMPSAAAIARKASGVLRVRISIRIAERFIFRPGELRENVDSARPFIETAIYTSDSINSREWLYQSLCVKAKYFFALGNIDSGRVCFQRMIRETTSKGETSQEAHWHAELGRYMPHTDSTYDEVISELTTSEALYRRLGDKGNQLDILEELAFLHKLRPNHILQAQQELLDCLALKTAIRSQGVYNEYTELSEINLTLGNYNKALSYSQSALRDLDSLGFESFAGGVVYAHFAEVYRALGDRKNSLLYFRKALATLITSKTEYLFPIGGRIIETLLEMDSNAAAIAFLWKFKRENPATRPIDKEIIAASEGRCFEAIRRNDLAERSYLWMIAMDEQAQTHMGKLSTGERSNIITGSEAYYLIGRFYQRINQSGKAKSYLQKALAFERFGASVERQINIHELLFQADSAQSDYLSAIHHQQLSQRLRDSVFNARKSKEIAELQIRYASEKREKDLAIVETNGRLKDKELRNSIQVRNITLALIAVLLILIFVGYSRYSQKQKNREEIDLKNKELESLVNEKDIFLFEKDNLLEEKENLIREIHHRVKNNLQIVISLLNTQTKYLNSNEAVQAITESRFRMQAMSLLHEKLYQSERTSSVDMDVYIPELIEYLKTSFDKGSRISFDVDVDPIELNLTQAIPLGLVINETVTNAIKYAFSGTGTGAIGIKLKTVAPRMVSLIVRDNGVGFHPATKPATENSMGMRLIHGLAKQLGGTISIEGSSGVCVTLLFRGDKPLGNQSEISAGIEMPGKM